MVTVQPLYTLASRFYFFITIGTKNSAAPHFSRYVDKVIYRGLSTRNIYLIIVEKLDYDVYAPSSS